MTIHDQRDALIRTLFPDGVPRLWCPLLTHYRDDGSLDTERIAAHIRHMRPWVSAFLAPGSTGDGWEMEQWETDELLAFLVAEAQRRKFALMVGVLRTEPDAVVPAIERILERFTAGSHEVAALVDRSICGFTVTPPKGADLPQRTIRDNLERIARTGVPIAIYQLPQVTGNEMNAETVEALAATYANVYLMKDTSGIDKVVLAKRNLANLFLVRGAEGDYARWIKAGGGHYDGLLLSTANSFAAALGKMIDLLVEGNSDEAQRLSRRVSRVTTVVFEQAQKLPFGNPFANANKAIDHHFAWGPEASEHAPPMTHSGNRLPRELIAVAGDQLSREGFTIRSGYLS